VFTSADGSAWSVLESTLSLSGSPVVGMAYGNGIYLLLCQDGLLYKSADLATWTELDSPDSGGFSGLACDGSRFYLSLSGGSIYSTADGASWRFYPLPSGRTYGSIIWAADMDGGVFMIPRAAG
jgi:hypothetical protein